MLIVPIKTESVLYRTPRVNIALIGLNIVVFALMTITPMSHQFKALSSHYLVFQSDSPTFYQFFTYQFLHADIWHLLGNMLFLWVFGNSVNAKMGHWPYLLFYLSGGTFAAWGYAMVTPMPTRLLGASGAIAAVTTAYLALYPRSRVTVLIWFFFFIHFFQIQALVIIGLKIIVWDNIVAPSFGGQDAVANSAHIAGYLFGFVGALGLLWIRAVPRDQFDILALWKRWHQRRSFASAMADPAAAARAQYGKVARPDPLDSGQRLLDERKLDEMNELRNRISEAMEQGREREAGSLYGQLLGVDDEQCLSERHQLALARMFFSSGQFRQAARAFERYVSCYANSAEAENVRLLLGIIYARDLRRYPEADRHLTQCMETLKDETRRRQCAAWLGHVRLALGRSGNDFEGESEPT